MEQPVKRRKLNFEKCSQCRRDKQKCLPLHRKWPQKCDRCKEKDYDCSASHKTREARNLAIAEPKGFTEQDESSDAEEALYEITLRMAWIDRVKLEIQTQQAFESKFATVMFSYDSDYYPAPLRKLEDALISERSSVMARIEDLVATKARLSLDFSLLTLLSYLMAPQGKAVDIRGFLDVSSHTDRFPHLSQLFQDPDHCVFEMNRLETKGLQNLNEDEEAQYLRSCSDFIHRLQSIYSKTDNLHPQGPYLFHWVPSRSSMLPTLFGSSEPRATDILDRNAAHIRLYRNEGLHDLGPISIIRELLGPDTFGRSVLHIAAYNGDVNTVTLGLDEMLGHLMLKDKFGLTPLHYAAGAGHASIVRIILGQLTTEAFYDRAAWRDTAGRTPLMLAASNGHAEVAELFLGVFPLKTQSHGLIADHGGWTALHYGVLMGHFNVVKTLGVEGLLGCTYADVNAPDNTGRTLVHLAVISGHPQEPNLLPILELLLERPGVDVNIRDKSGLTALHQAVSLQRDEAIVYLLCTPGIDITTSDNSRETALHVAACIGSVSAVHHLLAKETSLINFRDHAGRTALYRAADYGRYDIVKAILEIQAVDVNMKAHDGRTALDRAVLQGHYEIVKALLEIQAVDVNIKAFDGRTALHRAVDRGHYDIVKSILEIQAVDVNIKTFDGRTALHRAVDCGHCNIVKAILEIEAVDVNIKAYDGETPLLAARRRNDFTVMALLLQTTLVDIDSIQTTIEKTLELGAATLMPILQMALAHQQGKIEEFSMQSMQESS